MHILVAYDIPEGSKIANPSGRFRRFGVRVNHSVWVFPEDCVPAADVEALRAGGAAVRMIYFAEKSEDAILDLARAELRRHTRTVLDLVERRCGDAHSALAACSDPARKEAHYRGWRSTLARARRELLAAQQCALGFGISRDVQDATDALQHTLAAELDAALVWRAAQEARVWPLMVLPERTAI